MYNKIDEMNLDSRKNMLRVLALAITRLSKGEVEYYKLRMSRNNFFLLSSIIGIVLGLYFDSIVLIVLSLISIVILFALRKKIKINFKLKKIGVVGIQFKKYKIQNQSVFVDLSNVYPEQSIRYSSLLDADINHVSNILKGLLNSLNSFNAILCYTPKSDEKLTVEEENVLSDLRMLKNKFYSRSNFEFKIPLISPDNAIHAYLKSRRSKILIQKYLIGINENLLVKNILKMEGITSQKIITVNNFEGEQIDIDEEAIKISDLIPLISESYENTLDNSFQKIQYKFDRILNELISDFSFNYYCPYCNAELINAISLGDFNFNNKKEWNFDLVKQSRVTMIDIESRKWNCPLCSKSTYTPFKIHKIDDELFKPVYEKLIEENRVERLKIYNDVYDKKQNLAQKAEIETLNISRDNKAKIENVKSKLRTLLSEIDSNKLAIENLSEILVKMKYLTIEVRKEYEQSISIIRTRVAQNITEQKQQIDSKFLRIENNLKERIEKYKSLQKIEDEKKYELQKLMAQSITSIDSQITAKNIREGLFDKSNFNPLNWPSNISRSIHDTSGKILGKSEYEIAKDYHKD